MLGYIVNQILFETLEPFRLTSRWEISADKAFLLKKKIELDQRDRPTAKERLNDEWFSS